MSFLYKQSLALLLGSLLLGLPSLSRGQDNLIPTWGFNPQIYLGGTAYSQDGTLIGVGAGNDVCIFSVATQLPVVGVQLHSGSVDSFQFSPDGQTIAISKSNDDGSVGVEFWDYRTNTYLGELAPNATTSCSIAFSPNGLTLVTYGSKVNGTLKTKTGELEEWDVLTRSRIAALKTKATAVYTVAFSADGKLLAEGGVNGTTGSLELWNAGKGSLNKNLSIADITEVHSVVFPPNGTSVTCVAFNSTEAVVGSWDIATGKLKSELKGNLPAGFMMTLSSNATQVAVSGVTSSYVMGQTEYSSFVSIYDVSNLNSPKKSWNMGSWVSAVTFSADGSKVSATGTYDTWWGTEMGGAYEPTGSFLANWNQADGSSVTLTLVTCSQFGNGPVGAYVLPSFSPDGKLVAGGGADMAANGFSISSGLINVWDSARGTLVAALLTNAGNGSMLAVFSSDDRWLALPGSGALPHGVEIWDIKAGTLAQSLVSNAYAEQAVFSPNGTFLAVGASPGTGSEEIQIWNWSTGKLIEVLQSAVNNGIKSLAYSKDGSSLVVGGSYSSGASGEIPQGILELWNISTGVRTAQFPTKEAVVNGVTLSPDGQSIVASGYSQVSSAAAEIGRVESWNIAGKALQGTLPLYSGTVNVSATNFSSKGNLLFATTSGGPGPVQVFDTITGQLLGYLGGPDWWLFALSADGSMAVSGSPNLGISVYATPTLKTAAIKNITFSKSSIPEYSLTTATVTLEKPAPAGGITVGIESYSTVVEAVQLSNWVTIPAGMTTASFTVQSGYVGIQTQVTITALSGTNSVSAILTVMPPVLASFTLNSPTVVGGKSVTGTITISDSPGEWGTYVSVTASSSAVNPDYDVFIQSNQSSVTFSITTNPVTAPQTVTITTSCGSVKKSVTLTVNPSG